MQSDVNILDRRKFQLGVSLISCCSCLLVNNTHTHTQNRHIHMNACIYTMFGIFVISFLFINLSCKVNSKEYLATYFFFAFVEINISYGRTQWLYFVSMSSAGLRLLYFVVSGGWNNLCTAIHIWLKICQCITEPKKKNLLLGWSKKHENECTGHICVFLISMMKLCPCSQDFLFLWYKEVVSQFRSHDFLLY